MERPRERAIGRVRSLLQSAGFYLSDAHTIRPSSFDLLARRDSLLLIVKVLKNIDALDPAEARRLQELAHLFPATPLVVGQTSGGSELEVGVVYSRYGLAILSEATLQEYLQKGVPPFLLSSPGGIFAQIDGDRLRALRELHRLSLGALAGVAGVSRRTIQLYEEGGGAEVAIVERIESFLGEPIVRPLLLLEGAPAPGLSGRGRDETRPPGRARPPSTGDPVRDGVFRQLGGLGWQVTVTLRCPFDAFTQGERRGEEEILLTSVGSYRTALHRAEVLQQLARVAEGHALFVVEEAGAAKPLDGIAVLTVRQLKQHRDADELFDTIREQEAS